MNPIRLATVLLPLLLLGAGCSTLLAPPPAGPLLYTLDAPLPQAAARPAAAASAPTLSVNPPRAMAGFDSRYIVYQRSPQQLERFARSEWVDTPARMLAPLLVSTLDRSGAFHAVVLTPSAASGDLRLDTEIVRLQQDFGGAGSQLRFTLRATLVDSASRRVLQAREFDVAEPAASADTAGGVQAAQRAVQAVLQQVTAFCADAARNWAPPPR
jgi:cholesterol transport system auxiliary component